MYLSAVGPVVTAAWRACRFAFDVRPASKCRRFPLLCFSFPVPVTLNRFLIERFVLFLPAIVPFPLLRPGPPDEALKPAGRIGAKKAEPPTWGFRRPGREDRESICV